MGWLLPAIVVVISSLLWYLISKEETKQRILLSIGSLVVGLAVIAATVGIDIAAQTYDTEVWSGEVIDWDHNEEWDEWVPPQTTCTTDSKGNQSCTTTPGYWIHHDAENYIKTTDNGWTSVYELPDGTRMDDSYPNKTKELKKYWPKGTPTASTHAYVNKVQASYSVFKHENIDLDDFKDLPEYPDKVKDKFYIDRIVGEVPNKKEANSKLSEWNTKLNVMIPDPDKPGKKRSYKQVNIVIVNVGVDKPEEYGFALQDKWEGGNKNDFIVSFSMSKNGHINWIHPFSWSEVETLKLEVKDYMMSLDKVEDFTPVVDEVSSMVEAKFERKEFADFSYLHIDLSLASNIVIWVLVAALNVVRGYLVFKD